ncbi:MAG: STT3 domain-containing protein [Candidatus Methanofastidiosia archaeon]
MNLKLKKRRREVILIALLSLAFSLRASSARFSYLLFADPFMHFDRIQRLVESSHYPILNFYDGAEGSFYYVVGYEGMYFIAWIFHKFLNLFGFSLFRTAKLLPAIFGTLSAIPLYLLIKRMYTAKVALLTVLFYAITQASIEKSLAGNLRGDVFMLFFMLWMLYFFHLSLENKRYSFLSSLFLFLCGITWVGWPFAFVTLTACFLGYFLNLLTLKNPNFKNCILSFSITSILGLSLIFLFNHLFFIYHLQLKESLVENQLREIELLAILLGSVIFLSFLLAFIKKLKFQNRSLKIVIFSILLISAILLELKSGFIQNQLLELYELNVNLDPFRVDRTVTEQYQLTFKNLASYLGVLFILSPLGLIPLIRKRNGFVLGYIVASSALMYIMVRFLFLASPILCFLGALFLDKSSLRLSLVILLVLPNFFLSYNHLNEISPLITEELQESFEFIKSKTPKDSVILSWWDYTWLIQAKAERKTAFLGGHPNASDSELYSIFTENPTESLKIAKKRGVDYLLIDERTLLKWLKIKWYAQSSMSFYDSLLAKASSEPEGFELVFSKGDVQIYKIEHHKFISVKRYQEGFEVQVNSDADPLFGTLEVYLIDPHGDLGYREFFDVELDPASTESFTVSFKLTGDLRIGTYQLTARLEEKLASSEGMTHLNFAYKKSNPNSFISIYFFVNGNWHQISDGALSYPGVKIPHLKNKNWNFVTVRLSDEVSQELGKSPYGRIENFEIAFFGGSGDYVLFDSIYLSDERERVIYDEQDPSSFYGWGWDGFSGLTSKESYSGNISYILEVPEDRNSTSDGWMTPKNTYFAFELFEISHIPKETISVRAELNATFDELRIEGEAFRNTPVERAEVVVRSGERVWKTKTDARGNFELKIGKDSSPSLRIFEGLNLYHVFVSDGKDFGSLSLKFETDFSSEIVDVRYLSNEKWRTFDEIPEIKAGESLKIRFKVKTNFKPLIEDRIIFNLKGLPSLKIVQELEVSSSYSQDSNTKSEYIYIELKLKKDLKPGEYLLLTHILDAEPEGSIWYYKSSPFKILILSGKVFYNLQGFNQM